MQKRKLMGSMANGMTSGQVAVGSSNYNPIAEKTQALLSYSIKHANPPPLINGLPVTTSSNQQMAASNSLATEPMIIGNSSQIKTHRGKLGSLSGPSTTQMTSLG